MSEDEAPCTDCGDTGWTLQTERPCTCGAAPTHCYEADLCAQPATKETIL